MMVRAVMVFVEMIAVVDVVKAFEIVVMTNLQQLYVLVSDSVDDDARRWF